MKENPYQSPEPVEDQTPLNEPFSFSNLGQRYRAEKKRWDRRCWVLGIAFILIAMVPSFLIPKLQQTKSLLNLESLQTIALILYLAGVIALTIGPHSWFWFYKKRKPNDGS